MCNRYKAPSKPEEEISIETIRKLPKMYFTNIHYHKRIGINILAFWKSIASFIPALIAPICVGVLIHHFVEINGWVKLLSFIGVYTVVYCGSIYFMGLNKEEKGLLKIKIGGGKK